MIEIRSVRLPLDAGAPDGNSIVKRAAAHALGISEGLIAQATTLRRSVDARKRTDIHFVATLGVTLCASADEARILAGHADSPHIQAHVPYKPLTIASPSRPQTRPLVVGTGPAGLFAALYLARAGLAPLVIEQGECVEKRVAQIEAFNAGGPLDPFTNIQFGEGGAGTFSDGKLTTNTKNSYTRHVLQWFVDAGAPAEILVQAKPHIGTDRLAAVVHTLREQIEACGGEVRFNTRLVGLHLGAGMLEGISVCDSATGARSEIAATHAIIAAGHSARDTFGLLRQAGICLEQKPFSVGVRIEHPQALIDAAQYKGAAGHPCLGAADYKMAVHLGNGRSVYTFCMCPGGEVVCAASEEGGVVVNGMSRFAREGENANAAVLVGVGPADFGSTDECAGIGLQRRIEAAAYRAAADAGGAPYQAPAQTVGDFLANTSGAPSPSVVPTYARGVVWTDLHACLPDYVATSLAQALPLLDRKLHGFAHADAVLIGVETRSSSPVRVCRGEDFQAVVGRPADAGGGGGAVSGAKHRGKSGVFPCGEGAGYAGGIMSAAVDGLRCAEALTAHL